MRENTTVAGWPRFVHVNPPSELFFTPLEVATYTSCGFDGSTATLNRNWSASPELCHVAPESVLLNTPPRRVAANTVLGAAGLIPSPLTKIVIPWLWGFHCPPELMLT